MRCWLQISQLWLVEWGFNGLKNSPKGLRDVKERGISARKTVQMWGLIMKKSTLQVRKKGVSDLWPSEGPRPVFLAKRRKKPGYLSLQTALDVFLKSVKKFLDKEVRTIPLKDTKPGKWLWSFIIFFIPSPFIKLFPSIRVPSIGTSFRWRRCVN